MIKLSITSKAKWWSKQEIFRGIWENYTLFTGSDKALCSTNMFWYFSYFSTKPHMPHRGASIEHPQCMFLWRSNSIKQGYSLEVPEQGVSNDYL